MPKAKDKNYLRWDLNDGVLPGSQSRLISTPILDVPRVTRSPDNLFPRVPRLEALQKHSTPCV